jgi:hypothetical protein
LKVPLVDPLLWNTTTSLIHLRNCLEESDPREEELKDQRDPEKLAAREASARWGRGRR